MYIYVLYRQTDILTYSLSTDSTDMLIRKGFPACVSCCVHAFSTDKLTDWLFAVHHFRLGIFFFFLLLLLLLTVCTEDGIKSDLLDLYIRLPDFIPSLSLSLGHKSFVDLRQTGNPVSVSLSPCACVFVCHGIKQFLLLPLWHKLKGFSARAANCRSANED